VTLPELERFVDASAHPTAVLRHDEVVVANDALRAVLGLDPVGRRLDELPLPAGLEARPRPLDGDLALCSFVREEGLDAWLARLSDETVSTLLLAQRHDPVSLIDPETGLFVDVSEAWCRQYGWRREEAIGRMGPRDVSAEPALTQRAVAARARGGGTRRTELRWHRRKDGSTFPAEVQCGALTVGGRTLVYARPRNVEDRVRAEDALRRSDTRYRVLIEQLPLAVIVHREERLLYMNPAARELLGYDPEEDVSGLRALELIHPDDRADVRRRVYDSVYSGRAAPVLEERFVRRDGTPVSVEVMAIPAHFDGAPAALALARDVSARKAMEAQLVTADRLASLGRLAASVGHEINNPLAYLLGNLELLRRALEHLEGPARHRWAAAVDAAEHGALRVRDIVRDLKALSRGDEEPAGPAELGRTLDTSVQMASHELKHRARVVRDYGRGTWVDGSEARLGQLFLNLLVNAAQAIEEGARSDNEVRIAARVEGDVAVVEVTDTGRGLPADAAAERIFEPFFTTKRGSGTGLGLSICHHIARSVGGSIEAERGSPRGTTFRVRLPCAPPPRPEEGEVRTAEIELPPGRRALVVDDEPAIRQLLRAWLTGFDVITARSGREALEKVAREGPFDVIVCDLMMDDLTGMDVHERLARERPGQEQRIVFTTGGAFTQRAKAFVGEARAPCLDKPFRQRDVLRLVRRVLERSDALDASAE
jgi:PAS domain S-box-containing protein